MKINSPVGYVSQRDTIQFRRQNGYQS